MRLRLLPLDRFPLVSQLARKSCTQTVCSTLKLFHQQQHQDETTCPQQDEGTFAFLAGFPALSIGYYEPLVLWEDERLVMTKMEEVEE